MFKHQRMPISQIRQKDHPQLSLKSFRFFDLGLAQLHPVHDSPHIIVKHHQCHGD
jgi:hypothetical protein